MDDNYLSSVNSQNSRQGDRKGPRRLLRPRNIKIITTSIKVNNASQDVALTPMSSVESPSKQYLEAGKHTINLAEFGQTMHMQDFSRSVPTTPSGLHEREIEEKDPNIEKIKIVVAEENLDANSKSGDSDVHLLEDSRDSTCNVGQILARRESLDELIEDLEINSDMVKKDQSFLKQ